MPLIPLLIYKKFFVSGSESKIFINKVDFGPFAYLVKLLQFGPLQKNFLPIFLLSSKKFTMQSKKAVDAVRQDLEFTSKNGPWGGAAPPTRGAPRPKIFWLVNPPHGWVKPPKFRPNPRDGPSPCVSLTPGHSVKKIHLVV